MCTATDTTPVVPEVKKESQPAPDINTVAAAAPVPELKDTTPSSPVVAAESVTSKTADTDPIHSVEPVEQSEEPIMAEPITASAPKPAASAPAKVPEQDLAQKHESELKSKHVPNQMRKEKRKSIRLRRRGRPR